MLQESQKSSKPRNEAVKSGQRHQQMQQQSIQQLATFKPASKHQNLQLKEQTSQSDPRQVIQRISASIRQMPTKSLQKDEPTLSIGHCTETEDYNSVDYPVAELNIAPRQEEQTLQLHLAPQPSSRAVWELVHQSHQQQYQVETFGMTTTLGNEHCDQDANRQNSRGVGRIRGLDSRNSSNDKMMLAARSSGRVSHREKLLYSPFFQEKSLNSNSSGASRTARDNCDGTNSTLKQEDQSLPVVNYSTKVAKFQRLQHAHKKLEKPQLARKLQQPTIRADSIKPENQASSSKMTGSKQKRSSQQKGKKPSHGETAAKNRGSTTFSGAGPNGDLISQGFFSQETLDRYPSLQNQQNRDSKKKTKHDSSRPQIQPSEQISDDPAAQFAQKTVYASADDQNESQKKLNVPLLSPSSQRVLSSKQSSAETKIDRVISFKQPRGPPLEIIAPYESSYSAKSRPQSHRGGDNQDGIIDTVQSLSDRVKTDYLPVPFEMLSKKITQEMVRVKTVESKKIVQRNTDVNDFAACLDKPQMQQSDVSAFTFQGQGTLRHIFKTMDHDEFNQESVPDKNQIESSQNQQSSVNQLSGKPKKQSRGLKKDGLSHSSPQAMQFVAVKQKMPSMQLHSAPITNYLQATVGSQSDAGRSCSNRGELLSSHQSHRSSTKVPLVMRHCYANNEEKRRQVEANQAHWLESQSKVITGGSSSHSKQPANTLTRRSPLSNRSDFEGGTSCNLKPSKGFAVKKLTGQHKTTMMPIVLLKVQHQKKRSASPKAATQMLSSRPNAIEPSEELESADKHFVGGTQRRSRNPIKYIKTDQSIQFKQKTLVWDTNAKGLNQQRSALSKVKSPQVGVSAQRKKAFSPNPPRKDQALKQHFSTALSSTTQHIAGKKKSFLSQQQKNHIAVPAQKGAPNQAIKQHRLYNNTNSKTTSPIISTSSHLSNTLIRPNFKNFKLPMGGTNNYNSSSTTIQRAIRQRLYANSPNLNLAAKRDSTLAQITKAQVAMTQKKKIAKLQQHLTRSSHSLVNNSLGSNIKLPNSMPFQKSMLISNTTGARGISTSIYHGTVSPVKSHEDTFSVQIETTSSQQYPPVQTASLVLNQPALSATNTVTSKQKALVPPTFGKLRGTGDQSNTSEASQGTHLRAGKSLCLDDSCPMGSSEAGPPVPGQTLLTATATTTLLKDYQPTPGKLMNSIRQGVSKQYSVASTATSGFLQVCGKNRRSHHLAAQASSQPFQSQKQQQQSMTTATNTNTQQNTAQLNANGSKLSTAAKLNSMSGGAGILASIITPSKFELNCQSNAQQQTSTSNFMTKKSFKTLQSQQQQANQASSKTSQSQQLQSRNLTTGQKNSFGAGASGSNRWQPPAQTPKQTSVHHLQTDVKGHQTQKSRKHCKFNKNGSHASKEKSSQQRYRQTATTSSSYRKPAVVGNGGAITERQNMILQTSKYLDTIESVEGTQRLAGAPARMRRDAMSFEIGAKANTGIKRGHSKVALSQVGFTQKSKQFSQSELQVAAHGTSNDHVRRSNSINQFTCDGQDTSLKRQDSKQLSPLPEYRPNTVTQYKLPDSANSPKKHSRLENSTYNLISSAIGRQNKICGGSESLIIVPPLTSKKTQSSRISNAHSKSNGEAIVKKVPATYSQQLFDKDNLTLRQTRDLGRQAKEVENEQISARVIVYPLTSSTGRVGSKTPSYNSTVLHPEHLQNNHEQEESEIHQPPVCCSILTQNPCDTCRQPAAATVDPPEISSSNLQMQVGKTKLTKQRSQQNNVRTPIPPVQSYDTRQNRRNIEKKIQSQMNSVHQSNQGSFINLSVAMTESIAFKPTNPLHVLRRMQQEQNYVWLATYDQDVLHDCFMRKISRCKDQCLPWEFVPWRLYDLQVILCNETSLCLRREPGKETLCKIYLVQMEQVHDIVRYKNYMCERKQLIRQGVLLDNEGYKSMEELQKKYQVTRLATQKNDDSQSDDSSAEQKFQLPQVAEYAAGQPNEKTISASIPEEGAIRPIMAPKNQNYIVTMEGRREFDDLQDYENPPLLDLIYHEQTAMGLPVVFATNRDQSKLDDAIPQTPSYFKHLKSLKPDAELLIKLLQGLMQSFPAFSPEDLLQNYIEQIPGITGKLSEEELFDVLERSVNGVSIGTDQPHTKLLTPQQTSKMFELMSNKQVDPNDLQSGYQSLSQYHNEQLQYTNRESVIVPDTADRDVVFLGAESSGIFDQNDISESQQLVIDAFNREFQQHQQNFMNLQGSSLKYGYGIPGAQSSDTSQVDNFIFQNNINRFSNDVSQEYEQITPQREDFMHRLSNNRQHIGGGTTTGINSRNPSSHAIRLESNNTTSYQGACQVINFQQPIFRGHQWSNSGIDDQSANAKDEDYQRTTKINRGSSQGLLSPMTSPPFKQLEKPLNSAKKPVIFSGDNSAFVPTDQMTNSSAGMGGRKPFHKKTVFAKRKYFSSNVPSLSHRTNEKQHQAGYELPVEDFVTNVESIKPVNQDNQSACQNSNSLFIQSVRSRSRNPKTTNSKEQRNQTTTQKPTKSKPPSSSAAMTKKAIDPTTNRFELSQDDLDGVPDEYGENFSCQTRRQANAAINATNILNQFDDVIMPQQAGERSKQQRNLLIDLANDVHSQDNRNNRHRVNNKDGDHRGDTPIEDEDDEEPVSVRQQIVSEISVRRERLSSRSKELHQLHKNENQTPSLHRTDELESSQPNIEMFEQVSDIVASTCRRNMLPTQSSKENILEETRTQPSNSYQKVRPQLSKKIRMPFMSECKQMKHQNEL